MGTIQTAEPKRGAENAIEGSEVCRVFVAGARLRAFEQFSPSLRTLALGCRRSSGRNTALPGRLLHPIASFFVPDIKSVVTKAA